MMLIPCLVFTQDKIKVRVKGQAISNEISPKQAKLEALNDAKYNALIKAGITENVNHSSFLFQNEKNDLIFESFNDLISTNINGQVVIDSILWENKKFNKFGNMQVDVEVNAIVYKTERNKDPSFFFRIQGLKSKYFSDELLSFSFTPSQDGYLYIFNLAESNSTIIYPYSNNDTRISDVRHHKFCKEMKIIFPIHPAFQPGYTLELPTNKKTEANRILFVFSKIDIPFINEVSLQNIFSWIASIPSEQRFLQINEFLIEKQTKELSTY